MSDHAEADECLSRIAITRSADLALLARTALHTHYPAIPTPEDRRATGDERDACEARVRTCLPVRAGLALTAWAWLGMSDSGSLRPGLRRLERWPHRGAHNQYARRFSTRRRCLRLPPNAASAGRFHAWLSGSEWSYTGAGTGGRSLTGCRTPRYRCRERQRRPRLHRSAPASEQRNGATAKANVPGVALTSGRWDGRAAPQVLRGSLRRGSGHCVCRRRPRALGFRY